MRLSYNRTRHLPYRVFFVPYGGEAESELQERMNQTIQTLMTEATGDTILMFSHGGSIRNFARVWEKYQRTPITARMTNCCILKFTYTDHIFYLEDVIHHDFNGWTGDKA